MLTQLTRPESNCEECKKEERNKDHSNQSSTSTKSDKKHSFKDYALEVKQLQGGACLDFQKHPVILRLK